MNEESGEFSIKNGWVHEISIQRKIYSVTGGLHKYEIEMKEEYTFPENNWYLEFEECDRELVDNWRINIIKFSDKPCPGNYISYSGLGGRWVDGRLGRPGWGCFLITIDQFKKYILNIQEPIIQQSSEDLSYLIDFLKQQQIN